MVNLQMTDGIAERLFKVMVDAKKMVVEQAEKVDALTAALGGVEDVMPEGLKVDSDYQDKIKIMKEKKSGFDKMRNEELEFIDTIMGGIIDGKQS